MSINERKAALVAELSGIDDAEDRFLYLLERAADHPELDEQFKLEGFLVPGCQSKLWLVPRNEGGRCHFSVDSDSKMVKGIAAMMAELYSNSTPEEIVNLSPEFMGELGIREVLSFNRRNALSNIYSIIKRFADEVKGSQTAAAA